MLSPSQIPLLQQPKSPSQPSKCGAVYTKPWVVSLLLDLSGYRPEANLVDAVAVEPAAGEGAFLVPMAERLIASCLRQGRPLTDCARSIIAYELVEESAQAARLSCERTLVSLGVSLKEAKALAASWVRVGDYLAEALRLPPANFVIGNPPYIRLEDMSEKACAFYRETYPTMRGRADIYVAFFEAALRQLAPGGVCAFICADRWMSNQYGALLRRYVTGRYSVEVVIEMHKAQPFVSLVNAYPAITVIRNSPPSGTVVASLKEEAQKAKGGELAEKLSAIAAGRVVRTPPGMTAERVEAWFSGADPWPCLSPKRLALLKQLEAEFLPLSSEETQTHVSIGVATGLDRVFITRDSDLVERSRLLPLAMVPDTLQGRFRWSGHYLVNPWEGQGLCDLGKFPRLRAYFEKHRDALKRRHVAQRQPERWFRTIDRVHLELLRKPKLYFPDIKDVSHPVLDCGETYPHHNLYVIWSDTWDLEVLGGLLLSAVGQFFVECYSVRMRGGWLRFQAQYLRRIRVPRPSEIEAEQAEALRQAFRAHDAARATVAACEVYRVGKEFLEERLGGE